MLNNTIDLNIKIEQIIEELSKLNSYYEDNYNMIYKSIYTLDHNGILSKINQCADSLILFALNYLGSSATSNKYDTKNLTFNLLGERIFTVLSKEKLIKVYTLEMNFTLMIRCCLKSINKFIFLLNSLEEDCRSEKVVVEVNRVVQYLLDNDTNPYLERLFEYNADIDVATCVEKLLQALSNRTLVEVVKQLSESNALKVCATLIDCRYMCKVKTIIVGIKSTAPELFKSIINLLKEKSKEDIFNSDCVINWNILDFLQAVFAYCLTPLEVVDILSKIVIDSSAMPIWEFYIKFYFDSNHSDFELSLVQLDNKVYIDFLHLFKDNNKWYDDNYYLSNEINIIVSLLPHYKLLQIFNSLHPKVKAKLIVINSSDLVYSKNSLVKGVDLLSRQFKEVFKHLTLDEINLLMSCLDDSLAIEVAYAYVHAENRFKVLLDRSNTRSSLAYFHHMLNYKEKTHKYNLKTILSQCSFEDLIYSLEKVIKTKNSTNRLEPKEVKEAFRYIINKYIESYQLLPQKEEDCIVCYELTSSKTLCCRQFICSICINEIKLRRSNKCPTCRNEVKFYSSKLLLVALDSFTE